MLNSRFGQICWWPALWWFFATLVILAVILRRQVLGCIRQDSQTKECHLAKLGSPTHFQKQVGRGTCLPLATLTLVVTLPTTVCPLIFANSPTQNWCLQVIPFTTLNIHFFLTTVWIKIIVLSRSILITIQLFPNSAKDLEVRLNFEQATYCLRDWGASPYMTNNLL